MAQTPGTHDCEPLGGAPPQTPTWVKVVGIVAIALILLVIVLHLTGNSLGGPDMHAPPIHQGVQQP